MKKRKIFDEIMLILGFLLIMIAFIVGGQLSMDTTTGGLISAGVILILISFISMMVDLHSGNFYYTEEDMETGELFKLLFKSKPYRESRFTRKHLHYVQHVKSGKKYYCITDKEIDVEVGEYFTKVETETIPDEKGNTNKMPQFRKVEKVA